MGCLEYLPSRRWRRSKRFPQLLRRWIAGGKRLHPGFVDFVEAQSAGFYADTMGRAFTLQRPWGGGVSALMLVNEAVLDDLPASASHPVIRWLWDLREQSTDDDRKRPAT